MAVGAAIGDAVARLVDAHILKTDLLTSENPLRDNQDRVHLGLVASSSLLAGLASHVLADALPHSDLLVNRGLLIPNRLWPVREFLASAGALLILFLGTRGRRRWLVLASAVMGGLPDLESLAMGVGLLSKTHAIFPTHNGLIPHGKNIGITSLIIELGSFLLSLLWLFRKRKQSSAK